MIGIAIPSMHIAMAESQATGSLDVSARVRY
jgi:hypothetical protein